MIARTGDNTHKARADRVRALAGLLVPIGIGATLLIPREAEVDWRAWAALVMGVLLYAGSVPSPRWRRSLDTFGGLVVAGLIGLLIAGTGGAGSDYQDLFMVPLVFTAAAQSTRTLVVDSIAMASMSALPVIYDRPAEGFMSDLAVDLLFWAAAVAMVRVLSTRLVSSEVALESLQVGVQSLDDAVAVLDVLQGEVLYANPAATMLSPEHTADGVATGLTGQPTEDLLLALAATSDGTWRPTSVDAHGRRRETAVARLYFGRRECLVLVSRDVTSWHEAERAAAAARDREHAAAQQQARTARSQRLFLQSVSHELRTPLTAALGFTTILEERGTTLDAEELTVYASRARASTARLAQLVEGMTEYAQLTASGCPDERDVVDLVRVVRRATADAATVLSSVELRLAEDAVWVDADALQVQRLLAILLDNVARHTPPGTTAWVRIDRARDTATLVVEDDGPGVRDGWERTVFEPFMHGPDAEDDPSPGIGLGLALVAEYAMQHAGRAWIDRRPGGGTRVHVRLPVASHVPAERVEAAG